MILAALRNRVMQPDGTLVPWKSPAGLDMTIAVLRKGGGLVDAPGRGLVGANTENPH
jgi:hypothetical protein